MRIFVTPRPGIRVRDPRTFAVLAAAGEVKDDHPDWRRREADGDVTITPAPVEPEPKAKK